MLQPITVRVWISHEKRGDIAVEIDRPAGIISRAKAMLAMTEWDFWGGRYECETLVRASASSSYIFLWTHAILLIHRSRRSCGQMDDQGQGSQDARVRWDVLLDGVRKLWGESIDAFAAPLPQSLGNGSPSTTASSTNESSANIPALPVNESPSATHSQNCPLQASSALPSSALVLCAFAFICQWFTIVQQRLESVAVQYTPVRDRSQEKVLPFHRHILLLIAQWG